jgi:hypothetical protein
VVPGFCRILPDFLGVQQLSKPLKVLTNQGFRFLQQALLIWNHLVKKSQEKL